MFKLSIVAMFFALFALVVLADDNCEEACSYVDTTKGRCYYQCTSVTGASASKSRQIFYEALKEINSSCKTESRNRISCKNTPEFGECEQHLWNVGEGC